METEKPENLSDRIATYLTEKIVRLDLPPGEWVREQAIAGEFGVSRSPIREAIRILEKRGLVEIVPRCGARVTRVTEAVIEGHADVLQVLYGLVVRR
ncbi:GntR family transcriptional regulator [Desulfoluna butyratoxydans]|uniref:Transcription regulator hth gntr n=1 Tax=Desulfoluna butyratoxydans TaxID=231438 RepID=A0A4U8YNP0_9BACT|nr:GntR family transcriptional regulator [Desulfoluna butyratoxydans]VFQ44859.1 transcription regulator hth gntr [Desulfoluna butyratoxydans]